MTLPSHRLWFFSYCLQDIDKGLSCWYLFQQVHPCPIPLTFGDHARHTPLRPVVKPLEGFLQPGVQNPRIGPKHNHRLYHHHTKHPRCSPICPLSSPYIRHPSPFSLRPPEVTFHFWPIIIGGRQRSSQVPEQRDRRQRCTIRREYPPHPLCHLLST